MCFLPLLQVLTGSLSLWLSALDAFISSTASMWLSAMECKTWLHATMWHCGRCPFDLYFKIQAYISNDARYCFPVATITFSEMHFRPFYRYSWHDTLLQPARLICSQEMHGCMENTICMNRTRSTATAVTEQTLLTKIPGSLSWIPDGWYQWNNIGKAWLDNFCKIMKTSTER